MPKPKKTKAHEVGTPPIFMYFKITQSGKRQRTTETVEAAHASAPQSSTGIPCRDEGYGQGAYWDHHTTQVMFGTPTTCITTPLLFAPDKAPAKELLLHHLRNVTYRLLYSDPTESTTYSLPSFCETGSEELGLLLIPGVSRNTIVKRPDIYQKRVQFNAQLIQIALKYGQPIIAICGGAWELWETLGALVGQRAETIPVKHHAYRGGMPRIKEATGKIGHNVQVHRVAIDPAASILKGALLKDLPEKTLLPVNSVHWLACDENTTPSGVQITARAYSDDDLAPKRQGAPMKPDEDTVEAFETLYGAPVLGIQWHPEAYTANTPNQHYPTQQRALLKAMCEAGQTYLKKRQLLQDIKTNALLKKTSLHTTQLLSTAFFQTHCIKRPIKSAEENPELFRIKSKKFANPHQNLAHKKETERYLTLFSKYAQEKGYTRSVTKRETYGHLTLKPAG